MAPALFSPTASISSHTLSAQSNQPPMAPQNTSVPSLISALSTQPHAFLQPSKDLHTAALALAKQYIDPLAAAISQSQEQRQREIRQKKRKRGEYEADVSKPLTLKKVHIENFKANQVWEQCRRILDSACAEIEREMPAQKDGDAALTNEAASDEEVSDVDDESSLGEEGVDWEYDGVDGVDSEGLEGIEDDDNENMDDVAAADELSDGEDIEMDEEDLSASEDDQDAEEFVPDPNGINDPFFNIDSFNKTTSFLEQRDTLGEPAASDDEEFDWEADPFTSTAPTSRNRDEENNTSDESDEEGPTFGNADLNAPEGYSDDDEPLEEGEMDDMGVSNANNIMYQDFFAPPAQKASKKKKKGRPNPHNFPDVAKDPQNTLPDEDDVEHTMQAVHRDLFDETDEESDGSLEPLDPSDPQSRRSAHERRQAKIAEEIRRLERENVAKKKWALRGEVRGADRPMNSLLEEDLDFERAGKPVAVITAEVGEDIEALIKRRILANEFDEVRRRRPDDLATGPVKRGRFELDDTKSGKGLAEIYEEEHLRQTDPNFVDARDEKLKKEHAEIEALWKNVSAKLDSLSSWHYKPKPVAPNLEIRVDAPAIEMEDARPTAGGEVAGASMLAPQEVYKPGEQKSREEIVTKGGMPVAREEMTREQKLRRRRREKERIKKAGLSGPASGNADKKAQEKKEMLGDLKKGGVKIIGKKGQVTDVEGREVKEKAKAGAGSFKL